MEKETLGDLTFIVRVRVVLDHIFPHVACPQRSRTGHPIVVWHFL